MKNLVIATVVAMVAAACSNNQPDFTAIKILTYTNADTPTVLNKGLSLFYYLNYNAQNDSVVMRVLEAYGKDLIVPDTFNIYTGYTGNKANADSFQMLINFLRRRPEGEIRRRPSNDLSLYCGPHYYVEFEDITGKHYYEFEVDGFEEPAAFEEFVNRFFRLNEANFRIDNSILDPTAELVSMLKGRGTYDSFPAYYIPLPCDSGLQMNELYKSWMTIGDKYNNAIEKHWSLTVDTSGLWTMRRFRDGQYFNELKHTITAIHGNTITLKSDSFVNQVEVINLTRNCFTMRHVSSGQVWRYDRVVE